MLKAILFDLDGTLLPMDQDKYLAVYFKRLSAYMTQRGYDPRAFIDNLVACTYKMLKNDGSKTNEEVFWDAFVAVYGDDARLDREFVDSFYTKEFIHAKAECGFAPDASRLVRGLREKGMKIILATNPLFPRVAIDERIKWAGLSSEDFDLITTYENSVFCKPRPEYYSGICDHFGLSPEECLMVGNDVSDDMPASRIGMKTFLLTDCLINTKAEDISAYPSGSYRALEDYISLL